MTEMIELFQQFHEELSENRLNNCLYDFDKGMQLCESPIEKRLLAAMMNSFMLLDCQAFATVRPQFDVSGYTGRETLIIPQFNVNRFRLDFAVFWYREEVGLLRLAVECDGHDYHERTKEQARRDKSRDRHLMALGWMVVRFTGSEIHANAQECADEIGNILLEQWIDKSGARDE